MDSQTEQKQLKAEVLKKYDVVGIEVGRYQYQDFGEVDLEQLTIQEANQLFKAGFPHLVLKKKNSSPS